LALEFGGPECGEDSAGEVSEHEALHRTHLVPVKKHVHPCGLRFDAGHLAKESR
jgi:hypothetical protein